MFGEHRLQIVNGKSSKWEPGNPRQACVGWEVNVCVTHKSLLLKRKIPFSPLKNKDFHCEVNIDEAETR